MSKAKQGTLLAAAVVVGWLVTAHCPSSIAQEGAFGRRPAMAGDFAYEPLVPPGDEFANETAWGSEEAISADVTWTQRIARLARGRTQLEGGYSYLRGSAGGSDWTQQTIHYERQQVLPPRSVPGQMYRALVLWLYGKTQVRAPIPLICTRR